jgi:CDP-6-deoxy-D-xylo-4-hexulose-3-dehydrase
MTDRARREEILALVRRFSREQFAERPFVATESRVAYAGRVFDEEELVSLVDAALDFWLTTGRFAEQFERQLAQLVGARHALLCNSGSSANLLAVSALTSPTVGERQLQPGDEVITTAAGFPTTVNPIVQNRLTPVLVDVELGTYNPTPEAVAAAVGPRTKAIVLAHTLGNPFDLDAVGEIARRHGLWLVEDSCDALGSTWRGRPVGSFGQLATLSFYPAHHITTGEGGCVLTSDPLLKRAVESFRDWGRDCWCDPGNDNTCGKRFGWQLGDLPAGYDHKYIFSHLGYNLKMTDLQAAVGVAQLTKLPRFIAARRSNWEALRRFFEQWEEFFVLPRATEGSDPSWFGFLLTVREGAPFTRNQLTGYLEERRIATRLLFAGNLTRQPAYRDLSFRRVGELANSDAVLERTFWLGVYPGLSSVMLDYVMEQARVFLTGHRRSTGS